MNIWLQVVRVLLIAFIGAYVFLPNLVSSSLGPFVVVAVLFIGVLATADGLRAWKTLSKRDSK